MVKYEVRGDRIRLSVVFLVLALLIITIFSGLDIWEASATGEASSDLEVNVDPWIRVTIPTDTVTLDLNPTTEADFDSANLAVTVATNNEPGYTLTMSPSDNITTNLTRKNGTETIPTLTELPGGYTEQTFTTNTWGYKLATTNYLPFATTNEIGSNDTLTAGDTNTVTFASKIDGSVLDGTYALEVTFMAVGNVLPEDYNVTVSMDENVSSVTFNDGTTTQTATSSSNSVVLTENVEYTITATFATGYELDAWSATAGTLGSATSNPTTYTTASASTLSVTSQQSQVGPVPPTTCNTPVPGNYTYLQDINSSNKASVLASLTEGNAYYLRDSRDNEPYCISRLADGNLWFLDNLRLDLVAHKNDLNSTNTNASDTILGYLKNGGGSSPYPASGVAYGTSTDSYDLPYIAISGNCYNTTLCVNNPSSGTWNKDAPVANSPGSGSGKVGVYYNYCAASAGSYCYASNQPSSDPVTTSGYDIEGDICPKGWRMPTGGAVATGTIPGGEYQSLYTTYGDATDFKTALSTPLSGLFYSGSARYQGSSGYFWSATYNYSYYMYYLYVSSSNVSPQSNDYRYSGYSVRCVFGT